MDITVNYTVTISDDVTVQNALKALLDERIDPDNAGSNYLERFKAALKEYGTKGLKGMLDGKRIVTVIQTMRDSQEAIRNDSAIGTGVDN